MFSEHENVYNGIDDLYLSIERHFFQFPSSSLACAHDHSAMCAPTPALSPAPATAPPPAPSP